MNPYIADAGASALAHSTEPRGRNTNAINQESNRVNLPTEKPKESLPTVGGSKPKYSLYPTTTSGTARDTSFLGNSGEDEDIPKPGYIDSTSLTEPQQPGSRDGISSRDSGPEPLDSDRVGGVVRARLTPQDLAPPSLSPVVERFSQKSVSPVESPEDARPFSTGEPNEKGQGESRLYDDREDVPNQMPPPPMDTNVSLKASTSNISNYYTASNTSVVTPVESKSTDMPESKVDSSSDVLADEPNNSVKEQAQKLYSSQDQVVGNEPAAAWLGDPDRAAIRKAYMEFFDWSNLNILAALRSLCTRLVLKGETQQVDRVLDAFSVRWCECNPNHGFKAAGMPTLFLFGLFPCTTKLVNSPFF
jgi:hypothetical protein